MEKIELKKQIDSDLFRYAGKSDKKTFLYYFILFPGFRYQYLLRKCHYAELNNNNFLGRIRLVLLWFVFRHYQIKYGIEIHYKTKIGDGLVIYHGGCIVVGSQVVIGKNCCIGNCVTIGASHRFGNKGFPMIGDNVYISPGAKIIGKIKIGNNVLIGLNSVVVTDIPDNAVVLGVPGKVVSLYGSAGYIINPV